MSFSGSARNFGNKIETKLITLNRCDNYKHHTFSFDFKVPNSAHIIYISYDSLSLSLSLSLSHTHTHTQKKNL